MHIVIFLYDGFTTLDAIGPFESLSRLPDAEVTFVAKEAGMVANDNGFIDIYAPQSIYEVDSADILLVPGGFADEAVRNDPHQMDWVAKSRRQPRSTPRFAPALSFSQRLVF